VPLIRGEDADLGDATPGVDPSKTTSQNQPSTDEQLKALGYR
jgi:hypothetical protein